MISMEIELLAAIVFWCLVVPAIYVFKSHKKLSKKLEDAEEEIQRLRDLHQQPNGEVISLNGKLENSEKSADLLGKVIGQKDRELSVLKSKLSTLELRKKRVGNEVTVIGKRPNSELPNDLPQSRKRAIEEKGYDPYCIASVMKANQIPYSTQAKKPLKKTEPLRFSRHSASSSSENTYQYMGEDDPVHRPHHYERDEDGRRYRVYDDDY